jgi:alpha-beta hydrolase superfamily lysophospholipase
MVKQFLVIALALAGATRASAQIPDSLSGRLLFKLGYASAGSESFAVARTAEGGYRISGHVDLTVPSLHIVQHLEVLTDARLAFRRADVRAAVNEDSAVYVLVREAGVGVQTETRGDSTTTTRRETPASSVLFTNNVIHHIAEFAWLHDGRVGVTKEFLAFPRVPITVELQEVGMVSQGEESLAYRRYFLNIASRLGVYVWLAEDGTPLKVLIPLQAFEAISEAHQGWAELLVTAPATERGDGEPPPEYDAEDVKFDSDSITLAGTVTVPAGRGPWPAAVLITGSGPQDRDENTPGPGGLKLGIFRTLADTLTRRGLAVLRYDDRGVGGSGGSLSTAGLSDLVSDVEAAVRYLRSRVDVDDDRVALVGHSEGGIIAPIVAAADSSIAAIVLMAGTSTPLDSVLVEQLVANALEAGGDSADVARARESVHELSRALREGRDLDDTDLPLGLKRLGRGPWLREHIEHDPIGTLQSVQAPVLIVNGGLDVQVTPEHARRLGAALDEANHVDHEVKIFPELNHLFAVSAGRGTADYADPRAEVDPDFLSFLANWLTARLAPR